jgi:hypothetical protein
VSVTVQPEAPSSGIDAFARRQSWVRLSCFVLLTVLGAVAMTAGSRAMAPPPAAAFNRQVLDHVTRTRPELVLLGNSMVATRFDEKVLQRLLRPRRVAVLGLIGTASAHWYLALKNVVVASGEHPRLVQFFRGQELTQPRIWTEGNKGGSRLQQLSLGEDPLVTRKLAPSFATPSARLQWYRERAIPVQRLRAKTEPVIDKVGTLGSELAWPEAGPRTRKREINELFSLRRLRPAEAVDEQADSEDAPVFGDVVEQSFLPDILALARENHIPLTFVRVRSRAAASGEVESALVRRYVSDLERYLRAQGAEFYDMHDADWESIDMYGEGDHIANRWTRRYTRLFVAHMSQVFH